MRIPELFPLHWIPVSRPYYDVIMDHSHVIQFIIGKLLSLFQFGKLSLYGCVYTYTPALLSLPPTLPSHVSRLVQAPR